MGASDHQILQDFNFSMNLKALIAEIKDSERQLFRTNPRQGYPLNNNIHSHESDLHLGQ